MRPFAKPGLRVKTPHGEGTIDVVEQREVDEGFGRSRLWVYVRVELAIGRPRWFRYADVEVVG